MGEQINLSKLLEDGGIVCLAAYIKAEVSCSDQKAYDIAWEICDKVDTVIHNHLNDTDEE